MPATSPRYAFPGRLRSALQHTEAAITAQRAAEDSAHSHEREKERLADDVVRISAELAESKKVRQLCAAVCS